MSRHNMNRECIACGNWRSTSTRTGAFLPHGPRTQPCFGSGRTPEEVAEWVPVLPPLTDAQIELFRACWRVSDWRPIELEYGMKAPKFRTRGDTVDAELANMMADVRDWLESLVAVSNYHAKARQAA